MLSTFVSRREGQNKFNFKLVLQLGSFAKFYIWISEKHVTRQEGSSGLNGDFQEIGKPHYKTIFYLSNELETIYA